MARRSTSPQQATATDLAPEHWPFLNDEALQHSRGRRFCLSCQWFQQQQGWAPEQIGRAHV